MDHPLRARVAAEHVIDLRQSGTHAEQLNLHQAAVKQEHHHQPAEVGHTDQEAEIAAILPQTFAVQTHEPQVLPAVAPRVQRLKKHRLSTKKLRKPSLITTMAAIVFVAGLLVSINGVVTNRQVAAQANQLTQSRGSATSGRDNAPSTTKPSPAQMASYQVAPDLPRYIDIPTLGVHARVLQTGVNSDGSLGTPNNVFDTDWYTGSSKPGEAGAALIDGHISSWTTHGVFYGLKDLKPHDKIIVTRGDGKKLTYGVVRTRIFDANSVDMSSLLLSADQSKPGLNLISCTGDVIPGTNTFNERIAVYAVQN